MTSMNLNYFISKNYKLIIILLSVSCLLACSNVKESDCEIINFEVSEITCLTDSTYNLTINFDYKNPGNDFFEVYARENEPLGYFKLSDLPVTLENFKRSGKDFDFIKVCINDHPDCCLVKEFEAPVCTENNCKIWDLELTSGECISDSTYHLTLNFQYENAGNDFFNVYTRENKYIGNYRLSELPLTISNFKKSGKDFDYVKVCINDHPDCCMEAEIKSTNCQ